MSSLSRETDNGCNGWRLRFFSDGKRRSIRLGKVTKRAAEEIQRHINSLARTHELGLPVEVETHRWLVEVDEAVHQNLAKWGLCEPRGSATDRDSCRLLGPFLDAYIKRRTDCAVNTIINFKQTRRLLVEYFKENKPLRSITPADAVRWRQWMIARPLATASVSKYVKRTKTMIKAAVNDQFISSNPFESLKGGSESNRSRHFFISQAVATTVLDACPDNDWKLIFGLPRFAGLRCPTEVTRLKWSDIDWGAKRMRIDSSKTGERYCPIFPILATLLKAAMDDPFKDPVYCIQRYRGNVNLGTTLKRYIVAAGVKPWPKTFVNLRSSCRTELQDRFPSHVVDNWLGQSTKVAEMHYLQVTVDHWHKAVTEDQPVPASAQTPETPESDQT